MNIAFIVIGIVLIGLGIYIASRRISILAKHEALSSKEFELLEIQILHGKDVSEDHTASSIAAENLFATLHGLLREDGNQQEHFSFEVVANKEGGLRFYIAVPESIIKYMEGQIYAQYPEAQINVVSDYASGMHFQNSSFEVATLKLTKENYFPLRTYKELEVDPLSAITSLMSQVTKGEEMLLQYLVKPIADTWQEEGHNYVEAVRDGTAKDPNSNLLKSTLKAAGTELVGIAAGVATGLFRYNEYEEVRSSKTGIRLTATEDLQVRSIEEKLAKMGFEVEIRVISVAKDPNTASSNLRLLLSSFQQMSSAAMNSISSNVVVNKNSYIDKYKKRVLEPENAFILNTEELATVYHLPSKNLETPNISWVYSRKTEPPANLPTSNCVYLGETVFRSENTRFGLTEGDDRLRHMYVIGKSGTGKTTLFESMLSQDIVNGHGVGILDPHGETIERVIERIPDDRIEDVVYFDPSDTESPVGLNLMQIDNPSQKNLLASGLVSAIKQHFDYSWGPRLEYLLNYAVLTLLEVPGTTMLGITRLLEDQNYQNFILEQVSDPVVRRFWEEEWKSAKGNQRFVTEAIAPIQNKVNRFLASSTMRNILGQKRSTLDIEDAINTGKILLINLSKGKIGADNANLLGALIVSRIQFYALQRANIAPEDRIPFYLYVDEFQNFATGSFEEILSESRKYKLGLYLTHQFTAQLPEELLKAVYGNVGTIATFSLGAPDARALANEFAPYFTEEDIISLGRFELYIKLMINGMTSIPFSGRILLPWLKEEAIAPKTNNKEKAMTRSREKYGVDREYVEEKVSKWIETRFDKGMGIALKYKNNNNGSNLDTNYKKETNR